MTEHLGIDRIKLVVGFSMGAQQAFQWGALYPEMVQTIAPLCGSARTSPHNYLFLDGVKAALLADAAFTDGWYQMPPVKGLRAFSRVYAGWALSQDFFREREYYGLTGSSFWAARHSFPRYPFACRNIRHGDRRCAMKVSKRLSVTIHGSVNFLHGSVISGHWNCG